MGSEDNPIAASPTVDDLISRLQSSFFSAEFQHVAETLKKREELIKAKYLKLKTKAEEEKSALFSENLKLNDELKKKDSEIDEIRKLNVEYERQLRVYENQSLGFDHKVLGSEKVAKESMGSTFNLVNKKHCAAAESSKPPLFSEKMDSKGKSEAKLQEIINIDDDDDNDDDNGKHGSFEIKREYNTEDDGIKRKRKRVSKVAKREHRVESAKASPNLDKIDLESSEPDSDSDNEEIDKVYMYTIAKMKKPYGWKLESDMVKELEKNDELCVNGVCALHRQRIIVHGSDIERLSDLACKLIGGDSENKLKKKASELDCLDLDKCRMFAKKYSLQLFHVYENKSDPFFPTSRSQEKKVR